MIKGRPVNPKVLLADATYEIEKAEARQKGIPHSVTLHMIERRFGLRHGALYDWRANQFAPCKSQQRRKEYYERTYKPKPRAKHYRPRKRKWYQLPLAA